jgi:hypothetical protein
MKLSQLSRLCDLQGASSSKPTCESGRIGLVAVPSSSTVSTFGYPDEFLTLIIHRDLSGATLSACCFFVSNFFRALPATRSFW